MNYDFGIDKIEELPILKELLDKNAALYIVGGFLRDKLLNKESFDIDFIVQNQNAVDLAKKFAQKAGYTFVMLDEKYEIARRFVLNKTTSKRIKYSKGNSKIKNSTMHNKIKVLNKRNDYSK